MEQLSKKGDWLLLPELHCHHTELSTFPFFDYGEPNLSGFSRSRNDTHISPVSQETGMRCFTP